MGRCDGDSHASFLFSVSCNRTNLKKKFGFEGNLVDQLDFTFNIMSEEFDPFAEATPEEQAAAEEAAKSVKKSEKAKEVGKSTLVLSIKPADDTVNLDDLEAKIRAIQKDGLLWGKSQRAEMCFGLFAIQLGAVVTDDVSVDELEEEIQAMEDLVQSTEVIAFQKI